MTSISTSYSGEISSLYAEIAATEEQLKDSPFAKDRLSVNMARIRDLVRDLVSSNRSFAQIQTVIRSALCDLQKPSPGYLEAKATLLTMDCAARLTFREKLSGVDLFLGEIPFPEEQIHGGCSQSEKPTATKDKVFQMFSDPDNRVKLGGVSSEGLTPEGAKVIAEAVTGLAGKVGQAVKSTIDGIGKALGNLEKKGSDTDEKRLPPSLREYQAQIAREEARYKQVADLNERMRSDSHYKALDLVARFEMASSIVGGFRTESEVRARVDALMRGGAKEITVNESGDLITKS